MRKNKIYKYIIVYMLVLMFSSNTMLVHATEIGDIEISEGSETKVDSEITTGDEVVSGNETVLENETISENNTISENEIVEETEIPTQEIPADVIAKYNTKIDYEIPTLPYEEYIKALRDGKTNFASMEFCEQGKKSIKNITDKAYSVSDLNLDYEISADISYISEEVVPMTLPIPNLSLFVNNPESLNNGQPTTETELVWLYNDSDADGDSIATRLVEGFPEGYILGWVNQNNEEIGFVTRFFNPEIYTVDYYIMDSSEEINGIRYTIDILTVADYDTYSGDLSAADEVDNYTIPIDFTSISNAAITFIQLGDTDLMVTIMDENGEEISKMSSSNAIARRWFFIEKPIGTTGVSNYNVSVVANNNDYHSGSSGYRIMAGSKQNMEEMISYAGNAVLLGKYTATDSTYDFRTSYTPSNFESYYKFTADGPATITAMTNYAQTRFRILDAETMMTVYDSENDNDAHRTQYTSPFSNIEKQRLGFTAGVEYYLVIYANNPISTTFVEKNITLTQGMGVLRSGRDEFSANTSITAGTTGYSPSATISIGSTIPQTAEVKSVDFVSSDGVRMSDIKSFRVKAPQGHTSWMNSAQYWMTIDYPYTADGNSNTPLRGNWLYGFQASLSTQTMTPSVIMNYEYEYGD